MPGIDNDKIKMEKVTGAEKASVFHIQGKGGHGHMEEKERTGSPELNPDHARERFLKMVPETITAIQDMMNNPSTPPATRVALFHLVLERALGKAEVPVKISTEQESIRIAEQKLMALVMEFRGERDVGVGLMEGDEGIVDEAEGEAGGVG